MAETVAATQSGKKQLQKQNGGKSDVWQKQWLQHNDGDSDVG